MSEDREIIKDGVGLSLRLTTPLYNLKIPVPYLLEMYKELGFAVEPEVEKHLARFDDRTTYVRMSDLLKLYCLQQTEPFDVGQENKGQNKITYQIDVDIKGKTLKLKKSERPIPPPQETRRDFDER